MADVQIVDLDDIVQDTASGDFLVVYDLSGTEDKKISFDDLSTKVLSEFGFTGSAAELNIMDGVTASRDELNILDGVTAKAAELNKLDGTDAVVADFNKLHDLTATAAEINLLDGVTGELVTLQDTQTLTNKTLTTPNINEAVSLIATATELNKLNGATVTTAEINLLAGLTATTAELNILDGVTSTAAELNLLDAGSDEAVYDSGSSVVIRTGGTSTFSFDTTALRPTGAGIDLGSSGAKFEDLYIDGTTLLGGVFALDGAVQRITSVHTIINATYSKSAIEADVGGFTMSISNGNYSGQLKYLYMDKDGGGAAVLEGANFAGASLAFNNAGEGATLMWSTVDTNWYCVGVNGAVWTA